jgi:selenocysteine lyase/cysteine desulfurase
VVGPDVDPEPLMWGGTGVRSGELEHPAEYPWRLEAGTLNTLGIAGLGAALAWLDAHDPAERLDHEMALTARLLDGLAALPRITVQGPGAGDPTPRLPVVSFTVRDLDPERVGLFLDADWNVAVRTGLQCAPLAHRALGTGPAGSVRVSCGPFNTPACIDRLLEGLTAITA